MRRSFETFLSSAPASSSSSPASTPSPSSRPSTTESEARRTVWPSSMLSLGSPAPQLPVFSLCWATGVSLYVFSASKDYHEISLEQPGVVWCWVVRCTQFIVPNSSSPPSPSSTPAPSSSEQGLPSFGLLRCQRSDTKTQRCELLSNSGPHVGSQLQL